MLKEVIKGTLEWQLLRDDYPLRLRVSDARSRFIHCFSEVCPRPQWLPAYDEVVDWLTDNHRQGLLLVGGVGVGKTLIATKVIPKLFHECFDKFIHSYSAVDLNVHEVEEEVKMKWQKVIDDVGTEPEKSDYGVRRLVLNTLVDKADARGDFLVLTTNLTGEELKLRYGLRTFDRLRASCRWVVITSPSLRGI